MRRGWVGGGRRTTGSQGRQWQLVDGWWQKSARVVLACEKHFTASLVGGVWAIEISQSENHRIESWREGMTHRCLFAPKTSSIPTQHNTTATIIKGSNQRVTITRLTGTGTSSKKKSWIQMSTNIGDKRSSNTPAKFATPLPSRKKGSNASKAP